VASSVRVQTFRCFVQFLRTFLQFAARGRMCGGRAFPVATQEGEDLWDREAGFS
jgi:hypothetical protein